VSLVLSRVSSIFRNGKLVMCPHEECIAYEEICVMFILLALFMNVKNKIMFFVYIVIFLKLGFSTLIN
jgi:hypothetical protein